MFKRPQASTTGTNIVNAEGYTVVSQQFSINCKHSQSDKNVITNVMLDTGSQLTFIHENLRKILNLPTLYNKTLNIKHS